MGFVWLISSVMWSVFLCLLQGPAAATTGKAFVMGAFLQVAADNQTLTNATTLLTICNTNLVTGALMVSKQFWSGHRVFHIPWVFLLDKASRNTKE